MTNGPNSSEENREALPTGSTEVRLVDLQLADGRIPFREWYGGIRDRRARVLIQSRLDRVESGNIGDCKSVGKEIFELRIFYGPGYRIYFAKVGKIIIVLIGGGDKSTQNRDIATAQSLWEQTRESIDDAAS
jgi:putative addiction module killer protein